ncbi:hypothetical protein MMC13_000229 [Lambiella insularis]|nr:hypothetical protein [Lambiella insularis]
MQLAQLVKPGGWIQLTEGEKMSDGRNGPATQQCMALLNDVVAAKDVDITFARQLRGWLQDAGFVDVQERVTDICVGPMNKDAELGKRGVASCRNAAWGKGWALSIPFPSLPRDQFGTLLAQLRAELEEHGGTYPLRTVRGRKPVVAILRDDAS